MRWFSDLCLNLFEVSCMLGLALLGLLLLPFFVLRQALRGDMFWAPPKERPKRGFWNQR